MSPATDEMRQRREDLRDALCERGIPDYMHEGLILYVTEGVLPGDFMLSLLEHRFYDAAQRADIENQAAFWQWFAVLYNDVPRIAHGSAERVAEWRAHRGLRGTP